MATPPDEDMPEAEYVAATHTVIVVASHRQINPYPGTNEIRGIELDASGIPVGEVFETSSTSSCNSGLGNFRFTQNPRLAAGTGGQVALRYDWGTYGTTNGPAYCRMFQSTQPIPVAFVPPPARTGAAPGDFDGEGRPDHFFQNQETRQLTVWALAGSTFSRTLSPTPNVPDGPDWRLAAPPI